MVRVSGGLGAATVLAAPHTERRLSFIDSTLIAGADGFAGELGHAPIDKAIITERNDNRPAGLVKFDYDKAQCSCGKGRHHLEAFAGGDALLARLKASGLNVPGDAQGGARLAQAIFEGQVSSDHEHALTDVGRILGRALATPVVMLDPHSITLTGSLAYEKLRRGVELERAVWGSAIGDHLRVMRLPEDENLEAGVRGAGLAMLRNFVYRQMGAVIAGTQTVGVPLDFTKDQMKSCASPPSLGSENEASAGFVYEECVFWPAMCRVKGPSRDLRLRHLRVAQDEGGGRAGRERGHACRPVRV